MTANYYSNQNPNSSFPSRESSLRKNYTRENIVEAYDDPEYWMGVFSPRYDIPPICLAILVTMVNTYVIVLVLRKKSLRTVTNLLLCSLALSDLVTGALSIPLFIACNVIRELPVCVASDQFLRFTSVSTVSHLFAVTLDRYLAIIHSLRYCSLMTRPRGLVAICLMWMLSGVTSLVQLTWGDSSDVHEEPSQEVVANEIRYDVSCVVLFFGVPLVFMAFAYYRIFCEIVRQNRIIKRNSVPGGAHDVRSSVVCEFRAVLIFAFMLVAYIVCWLPYFIVRLEMNFDVEIIVPTDDAEYALLYLRFFTSLLNPFFYILGKNDFRKAVKLQLRRASLRSTSPSPTGSCASRRASNQTQRSRDICISPPVPDQIEL